MDFRGTRARVGNAFLPPLPQELPYERKLNLSKVSPVSAAFPQFVHMVDD